jgi:DNA polymerase
MPVLIRDFETRSVASLRACGAWRYSCDPSTEVLCISYCVDDDAVELWTPGMPIPEVFRQAASDPDWLIAAFNAGFEIAIETNILSHIDWPLMPMERQRCLQASALSRTLPAKLETLATALKLPVRKDLAGRRAMLLMSRPRRPYADEDPAGIYWHDDPEKRAVLHAYCRQDSETERAVYKAIGFLPEAEQAVWQWSELVNRRGVPVDTDLLGGALEISKQAKCEINAEIAQLTGGAVTSPNQTTRILTWLAANGVDVKDLQRETLHLALTRKLLPDQARRLIELRQAGSLASANKLRTMQGWCGDDNRIRGGFRYHGTSTGRFSSLGVQLQNLRKPKSKDILAVTIEAIGSRDLAALREINPVPLSAVGDISRALIKAAAGLRFFIADLSGIESRALAWLAGELNKLDLWCAYDKTGDPADEPYLKIGADCLSLPPEHARESGKTADLAFGYQGGVAAYRKLAPPGDELNDAQILQRRDRWRTAHPAITSFWTEIDRAARIAVRNPGIVVPCRRVAFYYGKQFLRLKLPSCRYLAFPFPKLKTDQYGAARVCYKDASRGRWADCRHGLGSYGGLWTENIVQAIARDIFVAGCMRLESSGYAVVAHLHDEVVAEVPEDFGSLEEFLQIFTAPPKWAPDLPLNAKGRIADRFVKIPAPGEIITAVPEDTEYTGADADTEETAEDDLEIDPPAEQAQIDATAVATASLPDADKPDDGPRRPSLRALLAPEHDENWNSKILCPFHDDHSPSLHVYETHVKCYACGVRYDAVDFLMLTRFLPRREAETLLEQRATALLAAAPTEAEKAAQETAYRDSALQLWHEAQGIENTLAERYLCMTRRINLSALPDYGAGSLRFHPNCPFGKGVRHPCLIALRRDALTDLPLSIHRIALRPDAQKLERKMLGRGGLVKLFPVGSCLVVGEGIETTLAAATRISRWGDLLQPAWSAVASGVLGNLSLIPGVERLVILVDNDVNGAGQAAARRCAERWSRSGRQVVRLTPKHPGMDFNDLVMEAAS